MFRTRQIGNWSFPICPVLVVFAAGVDLSCSPWESVWRPPVTKNACCSGPHCPLAAGWHRRDKNEIINN